MRRTTAGILAAIMLAALVPFLLLQIAIYLFWYQTRVQAEKDANTEIARSVASALESFVRDIRRQELVVGTAIYAVPDFSPELAGNLLSALKNQYSSVSRFSLVDDRGMIVSSSDPLAAGLSVADRSYYRDFISGKDWTVTGLLAEPVRHKQNFNISSRIATRDGRGGLIVAVIEPDRLGEPMLDLIRPAGGVYNFFDRDGNLVFLSGNIQPGHPNWKAADPLLRQAMHGREAAGTIAFPLTGEDHIAARVPIRGIGWTAGASRPVKTAMSPIYRNLAWIAALNAAILIISLLAAVSLSRLLIRRLDRLREYARRIAAGDFSVKASVTNPSEFAELESSLNLMGDQVKARQESLQKAVGDLTRSNHELEQFAYVASHDLQEPLRVITGFVQLIERRYRGRLDRDADHYIDFITDAVSRQQQLIRDLLAFSRLGRQELSLAPTDANRALQAATQNILQMIQEAGAKVTHDELPAVLADESQLVQLFQNLVSNGIKFRGPENPFVHISAQREDSKWIFSVHDNGIGIDAQYWDQIFVMFKRLHTRKDYPGTGIGLAICKKIVERHGGRIWVDSSPGYGTTFYFTLMAVGES